VHIASTSVDDEGEKEGYDSYNWPENAVEACRVGLVNVEDDLTVIVVVDVAVDELVTVHQVDHA